MNGWERWKRGDICVFREADGAWQVMRLYHQHHYKEWVGCFSIV